MDEIKKLKMMLEGKAPIDMASFAPATGGSQTLIQERIIYKERQSDNKENTQLEEELKNKENELKNEQEEKKLLQEKLMNLEKHF